MLFADRHCGWCADGLISEPDRIDAMAVSGDTLIAATRGAKLRRYDETSNQWQDLLPDERGNRGDRLLAPLPMNDSRIVTARVRGGRMNWFGSGATPLLLFRPVERLEAYAIERTAHHNSRLLSTQAGQLIAVSSGEVSLFVGKLESTEGAEKR